MKKFNNKQEKFNYYVLKSEWYRKLGDEFNCEKCLQKATEIKAEMENKEQSKR